MLQQTVRAIDGCWIQLTKHVVKAYNYMFLFGTCVNVTIGFWRPHAGKSMSWWIVEFMIY